jgi:hypothetical protein
VSERARPGDMTHGAMSGGYTPPDDSPDVLAELRAFVSRIERAREPKEVLPRARIGDLSAALNDPAFAITPEMQRVAIGEWLDYKSRIQREKPCEKCTEVTDETGEWRSAPWRARYDYRATAERGKFVNQRYWWQPCAACADDYKYLATFNRDWLVDVMLTKFGGDISRAPTLDELKGLL